MRVRLPPLASTAHTGKEDNMGKEAKIKAATKAFRAGDTATAHKLTAKITGRPFRRLTDRSLLPTK